MKIRIKNPIWGIPITGLKYLWSDGTIHTEYNGITPQFEIIDMSTMSGVSANYWTMINGVPKYSRVLIKKKDDLTPIPAQFEIIGITENADYLKPLYLDGFEKYDRGYVNGKRMYSRLLIKKVS